MKDLFRSYHRQKVLSHIGVVALSVLFAIGANLFLFSSDTGPMLKASILEATDNSEKKIDFLGEYQSGSIVFTNNNPMQDVREISFSLVYNSEEINLGDISVDDNFTVTSIGNTDGYITYILSSESGIDILENTKIISINLEKTKNSAGIINILNTNFKDSSENLYHLSSQGIIF